MCPFQNSFQKDIVTFKGRLKSIDLLTKMIRGEINGPMPKDIKLIPANGYKIILMPYKKWQIPPYIDGMAVAGEVQVYFGDPEHEDFYPVVKIKNEIKKKMHLDYVG